jgi:hypothetical protein
MHLTTKKVAFTSFYGTGKTTLLKLKAKEILKRNKNEKVLIVVIEETKEDSILLIEYRNTFKNEDKTIVLGLHNIQGTMYFGYLLLF